MTKQPLVAVPADKRFFDGYDWHATPNQYLEALVSVAGVFPVVVPAFGGRLDLDSLLQSVDGVLVTGSKSNVHPSLYGGEASEANGPYDPDRDATSLPLIRQAIGMGVPLLAICRGIQEMNVALGGTLIAEVQEMEGRVDHRAPPGDDHDQRFAIRQPVRIAPGSCLADIFEAGEIMVNSVHRQAVGDVGSSLVVEAVAQDGTVEAVSVRNARGFAVGVQWHPEYWARTDDNSARIFRAFGDAVRARNAARARYPTAAE